MDQSDSDIIEAAALGRPFTLGMLYDGHRDKIIPGLTLWDMEKLEQHVHAQQQESTSIKVIHSDSISSKASALSLDPSLKISLLCGLLEVGGSASYLKDTKKSKNQIRISMRYSRSTRFEQLTMSHLGSQHLMYNEVFSQGTATHVVVGILYGAHAFFVFDKALSSEDKKSDVHDTLKLSIQKIPKMSMNAGGSLQLSDDVLNRMKDCSCQFHGDFALEENPSTYEEAVKIYSSLPKQLQANEKLAVPIRVWLYPLVKLNPQAAKLTQDISDKLLCDLETEIELMNDVDMQCNDLMQHPGTAAFSTISDMIDHFRDLTKQYKLLFRKQLARILPLIREGKDENMLTDFLVRIIRSPFNNHVLDSFTKRQLQQVNHVSLYLDAMKELKVVSIESELQNLILNPDENCILSFNFSSLADDLLYLQDLRNWLKKGLLSEDAYIEKLVTPWHQSPHLLNKARQYLKAFKAFYMANKSHSVSRFMMSSVPDNQNPGVSIHLYYDGKLANASFVPPAKPSPPVIGATSYDSIELIFKPAETGMKEITHYLVQYRQEENEWREVHTEGPLRNHLVKNLLPNTRYQFRCVAVCLAGWSEASDASDFWKTLPTSPPSIPRALLLGYTCLTVKWHEPTVIGAGVKIIDYMVEYKTSEGSQWIQYKCGKKKETCNVASVVPGLTYNVRVSAICEGDLTSDPSDPAVMSITSNQSPETAALRLLKECVLLEEGQPSIFRLNAAPSKDLSKKFGILTVGEGRPLGEQKVILLFGLIGTDRQSLVSLMINFYLGVHWENNFRLNVINENAPPAQHGSLAMTVYEINCVSEYPIPSFLIVDVPVHDDIKNVDHGIIMDNLHKLTSSHSGIDGIHSICIFMNDSPVPAPKQYLGLQSVFSMFARDVQDRIHLFINCSDLGRSKILDDLATSDIPFLKDKGSSHFKLHSSTLFAKNRAENPVVLEYNEVCWKDNETSLWSFFGMLATLDKVSLEQTREVLSEQRELAVALGQRQMNIEHHLYHLQELRRVLEIFQYKEVLPGPTTEVLKGHCSVDCIHCKITPCLAPDHFESLLNSHWESFPGASPQSPCAESSTWLPTWAKNYLFPQKHIDKQLQFDTALVDYWKLKQHILQAIRDPPEVLGRLQSISLCPYPCSMSATIDHMIKMEKVIGNMVRVRCLKELKMEAEVLEMIDTEV